MNWQKNLTFRLVTALFSGTLMGLTVAPVGAWFLAWFAIAPLWYLVTTTKKKRNILALSLAWGVGYHGIALFWITGIHPMTWMGVPWLTSLAIAAFCWIFITLWGAAIVVAWGIGMNLIIPEGNRGTGRSPGEGRKVRGFPPLRELRSAFPATLLEAGFPTKESVIAVENFGRTGNSFLLTGIRVLIGTALWCGIESFWSLGPLYWSSISYTQSPHNLLILHLGQFSGNTAITAALVAVNGLIAEGWINYLGQHKATKFFSGRFVYPAIPLVLVIILHFLGIILYIQPLPQSPEAALKIGVIQGNIPNQIKLYPEGFRRALAGYTTGYLALANQDVDAVLTPEAALPFSQDAILNSSLVAAVKQKSVVAWIGGFDKHDNEYTNSLFTVNGQGKILSQYGKVKLVPIGEYIPFEGVFGGIVKRLSPLDEHQVPGKPNQIFNTPFGKAIVGICFESAFEEIFRYQAAAGGEFILSSSNDAHYSAAMPAQHQAQDIMRAIATDRWAVRATNTGYSAFVNPHGKTVWISQLNTYEIHSHTIYKQQNKTLYVRWGDWLTPLLLILALFARLII